MDKRAFIKPLRYDGEGEVSSIDYVEGGNRPEDFLIYGKWMKEQGIDLIDCSTGGIAMVSVARISNQPEAGYS